MKHLLTLAFTAVVFATATPAQAGLIDARFSGTVDSQVNSIYAPGATVTGEFVYDTIAARYLSFVIGGQSVATGYQSSASITPDLYSAIYRAQVSPVSQGGDVNSTFAVDLEGINPWPSNDAIALLVDAAQLASNLDTTFSTFSYYVGDASGNVLRSLGATLNAIQVTAVPEPGTVTLLFAGMAALGLGRTRRRR